MAVLSFTKKISMSVKNLRFHGIGSRLFSTKVLKFSTQAQQDIQYETQTEETGKSLEHLNPINHPDFFGVKKLVSVNDLFHARVHYGHKEGSLDQRMLPFIYGSRLGHLIFDLDKTLELLHKALNIVAHIAYRDGVILFVAQSPQNGYMIETAAKECGEYAHTRFWRQGMFTNSTMIFGAVTRLPDLVIVLNTLTTVLEQHKAVVEASKLLIPTVGIVDTNCNPNLITYPVPGNDDTPSAISLYCKLFKKAILIGKEQRKKVLEEISDVK